MGRGSWALRVDMRGLSGRGRLTTRAAGLKRLYERLDAAVRTLEGLVLKLLRPGGLRFTFSCSGGIGPELFHKIVAGVDAGWRSCSASRHRPTIRRRCTFPKAAT